MRIAQVEDAPDLVGFVRRDPPLALVNVLTSLHEVLIARQSQSVADFPEAFTTSHVGANRSR
jgi:hypothetical protein